MQIHGYEMVAQGELRPASRQLDALAPGEVLVEVAGCGVCHTDLGFFLEGVRTRRPPPLILGHEVSGFVRETGSDCASLRGAAVVVPAVIPCGRCADCLAGAPMICKRQIMPGNDRDGGFATHVVVPAHGLCVVPGVKDADSKLAGDLTLRHLAVIADAVSTPYQALRRAGTAAGDLVVVIGLGGVGGYAAQLAHALGAHVAGLDLRPERLEAAASLGVGLALDPRSLSPKELKAKILAFATEKGAPGTRWTLMECSGSAAGQRTAWSLLVHGATLCVVGFTMDNVELRLSNLMAFDARALGNWGCAPELYPAIVKLALEGHIDLVSPTELRPLQTLPQAIDDVAAHRVERRLVMVP